MQQYCSRSCASKNKKNTGRFCKGDVPWNKGMKGYLKGRKFTEEHKRKIGIANTADKSPQWKGDEASYSSKHKWMIRHMGKAKKCSFCGAVNNWIDWANISGEYKRDMTDWIQLCRPCHKKYDSERG